MSEFYTGWGCQEGGNSDVADTALDAWNFGLDQDERGRLIDQVRGKGLIDQVRGKGDIDG